MSAKTFLPIPFSTYVREDTGAGGIPSRRSDVPSSVEMSVTTLDPVNLLGVQEALMVTRYASKQPEGRSVFFFIFLFWSHFFPLRLQLSRNCLR